MNFPLQTLQITAAVLAWYIASKRRYHRAMAFYLSWAAAVDSLRVFILAKIYEPTGPMGRLMFQTDQILFLSVPVALLGVVICRLDHEAVWHVTGAFLALSVALVVGYPTSAAPWVYQTVYMASMVPALVGIVWLVKRDDLLLPGNILLAGFVMLGLMICLMPFADVFRTWPAEWMAQAVVYSLACLVQAGWLWDLRPKAQ